MFLPPLNLIIAEYIQFEDGRVSTVIMASSPYCQSEFANGSLDATRLDGAQSVCIDPLNPSTAFYISCDSSLRYCDGETVSLVVGAKEVGYRDGNGEVRFWNLRGLVCMQSGDQRM